MPSMRQQVCIGKHKRGIEKYTEWGPICGDSKQKTARADEGACSDFAESIGGLLCKG